ncbi:MAG TPA: hypothetical protein VF614_16935 [Chthoniobacteraceae bacterium]|jgi:hypothetical protein
MPDSGAQESTKGEGLYEFHSGPGMFYNLPEEAKVENFSIDPALLAVVQEIQRQNRAILDQNKTILVTLAPVRFVISTPGDMMPPDA